MSSFARKEVHEQLLFEIKRHVYSQSIKSFLLAALTFIECVFHIKIIIVVILIFKIICDTLLGVV